MLPAEGHQGAIPDWPLAEATEAEVTRWRRLWRTPQAARWAPMGIAHVVARYARMAVAAAEPGATAALLAEVRALEDRLGLSPTAMNRLRWVIGDLSAEDDTPAAPVAPVRRIRPIDPKG